ncbi:MAG: manganese efflux pump [Hyphomicrobiales bacterium]
MSLCKIIVISLALSIDGFLASVGLTIGGGQSHRAKAARVGLVFGITTTVMTLAGWAAGLIVNQHFATVSPYVPCSLFIAIGGHMIFGAISSKSHYGRSPTMDKNRDPDLWVLIIIAVGAGIDAMVTGVSLAIVDSKIVPMVATIGLTTFFAAASGALGGRLIALRLGCGAEIAGGVALIILGLLFVTRHMAI